MATGVKMGLLIIIIGIIWSCNSIEEDIYTHNYVSYALISGSEYNYDGVANVRELKTGGVEIELVLSGQQTSEPYFYPAHLHSGAYDSPNTTMAQMLSPVDARSLKSKTVITHLHDGSGMDFNRFTNFNGHIKVHLAEDGPDYNIILVMGNVGANNTLNHN